MPNAVKYKTGNLTGSLQKGNVALGVSGSLGPTSTTGWYNGPNPVAGKYQIFETAVSGDPEVYSPQDDAELIKFARWKGATGADTGSAAAVLAWIGTQTNLMAANFQYENIVTDGLVLNLDAGFVGGYPTTGTSWYDLSGNTNNGTLINGPTFNSANSGSIVFDGVDDYVSTTSQILSSTSFTINFFIRATDFSQSGARFRRIVNIDGNGLSENPFCLFVTNLGKIGYVFGNGSLSTDSQIPLSQSPTLSINNWYNIVLNFDGTSKNLYVNGLLYQTINNNGSFTNTSNKNLIIGYYGENSNGGYWSGNITIGQIYNRALTSVEVLQNYNAQKGRFGL